MTETPWAFKVSVSLAPADLALASEITKMLIEIFAHIRRSLSSEDSA